MENALVILKEIEQEFGLCAERAHLITLIRQYERLTGECSGVGMVLHWIESAVSNLRVRAAAFSDSGQTAAALHQEAVRLRSYVDRLRALGFLPTDPLSIHEPAADMGRD
jgi:hypothetical protein